MSSDGDIIESVVESMDLSNFDLPSGTLKRLPKILLGLQQGLNYTEIGDSFKGDADKGGFAEITIFDDMKNLQTSGFMGTWLRSEWNRRYMQYANSQNPDERELAFKELTKLVAKDMGSKLQINTKREIILGLKSGEQVLRILESYEGIFDAIAGKHLKGPDPAIPENGSRKHVDNIQSNAETD